MNNTTGFAPGTDEYNVDTPMHWLLVHGIAESEDEATDLLKDHVDHDATLDKLLKAIKQVQRIIAMKKVLNSCRVDKASQNDKVESCSRVLA